MIRIDNLTVRYGTLTAVDSLSLEIERGELFGLIGSNGAGKTTTLKVLAGLLLPDEGSVAINGCDVVEQRHEVQRSIGYMADFFGVYDYLTTSEYLSFFGALYGVREEDLPGRIDELLDITGLIEKRESGIRELSRGMKQRLYFARALVHDPGLLILDEPASGMDPRGRMELVEVLRGIHEKGKTVIISSHILGELEDLCTSIGVLEKGKLVGTRALVGAGSGEPVLTVVLQVHGDDTTKAIELLNAAAAVSGVEREEDSLLVSVRGDDSDVSRLVKMLAAANIRIMLPRRKDDQLQELFMKMTKGELM